MVGSVDLRMKSVKIQGAVSKKLQSSRRRFTTDDTHFFKAVTQAAHISKLTTMSAGIMSTTAQRWQKKLLYTPLLAALTIPVGPFQFSIHPGTGSVTVERTVRGEELFGLGLVCED